MKHLLTLGFILISFKAQAGEICGPVVHRFGVSNDISTIRFIMTISSSAGSTIEVSLFTKNLQVGQQILEASLSPSRRICVQGNSAEGNRFEVYRVRPDQTPRFPRGPVKL